MVPLLDAARTTTAIHMQAAWSAHCVRLDSLRDELMPMDQIGNVSFVEPGWTYMALARRMREAAWPTQYANDEAVMRVIDEYKAAAASSAAVAEVMTQARYGADPYSAIAHRVLMHFQRTGVGGRFEDAHSVTVMV